MLGYCRWPKGQLIPCIASLLTSLWQTGHDDGRMILLAEGSRKGDWRRPMEHSSESRREMELLSEPQTVFQRRRSCRTSSLRPSSIDVYVL